MSFENNITTCDLLEITSRQGEFGVEERVSDSGLSGSLLLPFGYTKGAARVLTCLTLDPATKLPEFGVGAAKLSKLN